MAKLVDVFKLKWIAFRELPAYMISQLVLRLHEAEWLCSNRNDCLIFSSISCVCTWLKLCTGYGECT